MKPTEIILPITPMLDMSFQLLFFFICIYKPPQIQEAQFVLDLTPVKTKEVGAPASSGDNVPPTSKSESSIFDDDPATKLNYDPEIRVYTHATKGEKDGDADYVISQITITKIMPEAKKVLFPNDPNKEPVKLNDSPNADTDASPEHEREMLERLPKILQEARDKVPGDARTATPRVKIFAPKEIRMYKIIKLMGYCNEAGFGVQLKLLQ
jgi:hypothetical protein